MRLLVLTGGGEPPYSSNQGLIAGFRSLGHEVLTVGPGYWSRQLNEIDLPDRQHPEYYSYEEVLDRVRNAPDWILNVEPHAFLTGQKPPGMHSAFYATDYHRAGEFYHRVISQGSFDVAFIGQPHYASLYGNLGIPIITIPVGFDSRRFDRLVNPVPRCQISFVGQTGIAKMAYPFEDEIGHYATAPPAGLPLGPQRFAFWEHGGFDYAERAEILSRLCRDFDVRMYADLWDRDRFQAALQAGQIGVNRSVLNDITLRVWEVLAVGRPLVCDSVPGLSDLLVDGTHCLMYGSYFRPHVENFRLEYEQVRNKIHSLLIGDTGVRMGDVGQQFVWQHHTWDRRAKDMVYHLSGLS